MGSARPSTGMSLDEVRIAIRRNEDFAEEYKLFAESVGSYDTELGRLYLEKARNRLFMAERWRGLEEGMTIGNWLEVV